MEYNKPVSVLHVSLERGIVVCCRVRALPVWPEAIQHFTGSGGTTQTRLSPISSHYSPLRHPPHIYYHQCPSFHHSHPSIYNSRQLCGSLACFHTSPWQYDPNKKAVVEKAVDSLKEKKRAMATEEEAKVQLSVSCELCVRYCPCSQQYSQSHLWSVV